jgi:hypothetical protein
VSAVTFAGCHLRRLTIRPARLRPRAPGFTRGGHGSRGLSEEDLCGAPILASAHLSNVSRV